MPTKPCPSCGKPLAPNAHACPACGHRLKMSGIQLLGLALVVLFVLFGAAVLVLSRG